jgi:MauM/NapG family ferredoxin protein
LKKERSKKYRLLQKARILTQLIFFGFFFILLLKTHFPGEDYISNVEGFFHWDPLLALTTTIASRVFFIAFLPAVITLVLTFFLGRVACGWICPLGSVHQLFSFVFKKTNLHRPKKLRDNHTAWKYYIFVFILVSAVFTLDLVGLFDPISFLYRSVVVGVLPILSYGFSAFIGLFYQLNLTGIGDPLFQFFQNLDINAIFIQGFFIGTIFIGIVLLNMVRERFWCRYICPLGALLGLVSRWNIFDLKIDKDRCIDCALCTIQCQTQANPFPNEDWKSSECVYCFTCAAICPTNAILFPAKFAAEKVETIDLSRRKLLFTSLLGIFAMPFFRISPTRHRANEKLIRPPGALPEEQFLKKCVKCGECMKVCPTNAIQPVLSEAGPEGIWTPKLDFKIGYCDYYCSLCTQVCPTGAIKELTIEAKNELKIGSVWVDRNRCIPWKFGDPCIVCEEHCPVSPKAIKFQKIEVLHLEGIVKTPLAPIIDLEQCTGCGICENKCPVVDAPAIYITSVGETRSEKNQMLLDIIKVEETIF